MRTVVNVSDELIQEALKVTGVKDRATAINLGLQELINHWKIEKLRKLKGKISLRLDLNQTRQR